MRRFLLVGLILSASTTARSSSPDQLDADAWVARVLAGPAGAVVDADAARGRAAVEGTGLWANPGLRLERQSGPLLNQSQGSQDFLSLEVALPISGHRGLSRQAAEQRARASDLDATQARATLAHDALQVFIDVVATNRRHLTLGAERATLLPVVEAARRRAEAGESSKAQALRLALELARVDDDVAAAAADRAAARARAEALAGGPVPPFSDVLPGSDSPLPSGRGAGGEVAAAGGAAAGGEVAAAGGAAAGGEVAAAGGAAAGGEVAEAGGEVSEAGTGGGAGAVVLQALQQRSEAAATDEDAANRRIIPDLILGGGPSLLQTGSADMSVGYLVTVGIELPVFDRGQGDAARARKERLALDAQRDVVSLRLDSARAAASARAVSARTRSEAFAAAVVQARGLFDAAAADFGVGSGDVVAFVDAAAAVREARLHLITVQADAARADVDLALVNGALGAPSESTP